MPVEPQREPLRDRLRRALKSRGWTRQKFADKAGLDLGTIDLWLRKGEHPPDGRSLMKVAEGTGLSPTWLLTGQGPEWIGQGRSQATLGEDLRRQMELRLGARAALLPPADMLLHEVLEDLTARYEQQIEQMFAEAERQFRDLRALAAQQPEWDRLARDTDRLNYLQAKHGFEKGVKVFNEERTE